MSEKIFIVDDDIDILHMLEKFLRKNNFEVFTAHNGKELLNYPCEKIDLFLLDIMMPEIDGIALCREIRKKTSSPIIFLTAKVEEADKVDGLEAGADDYVEKPFLLSELLARIRAHLRRENLYSKQTVQKKYFGEFWIDYETREIGISDKVLELTRTEYDIIALLSLHPHQIFSREHIYEKIWGYDAVGNDSAVTEFMKRIRKKLREYNADDFIVTVWGIGYRWKEYNEKN